MHRSTAALTLVELIVVIALIGALSALLLVPVAPTGSDFRSVRAAVCQLNIEAIGVAMSEYRKEHGTFPPAYTVDAEGNRLHSWRTLLLPYLGYQSLYDSIDLTRPWDHAVNDGALEVSEFSCPSVYADDMSTYLALVGPDWAFTGAEPRTLDEIEDGAASTLAIIDVGADRAVHWMSPEDIDVECPFDLQMEGNDHPNGHNVLYLDGSVGELNPETPAETFAAMLTIAGGESVVAKDATPSAEAPSFDRSH